MKAHRGDWLTLGRSVLPKSERVALILVAKHFHQGDHQWKQDITVTATRYCFSDEPSQKALEMRLISSLVVSVQLGLTINSAFFKLLYISTELLHLSISDIHGKPSCLSLTHFIRSSHPRAGYVRVIFEPFLSFFSS